MGQKVNNPNIAVSLVPSKPVAEVAPKVTTFILQMATGTATAGVKLIDIDLNTEDALFGADSMVATAIRKFRADNEVSQIDVIPLADNGSAVKATGSYVFAGTATASGTIEVYVGNDERKYELAVAIGDTATVLGDALVTALTADTKALVTGVNTTGSVALTAVNGGTIGNYIGIKYVNEVAGITSTLTAMTSGSLDPALTGVTALLTERTDIVTHIDYAYSTLVTDLDGKFNAENIAMDGRCLITGVDTKSNLVIIGDAENSQSLVIIVDKPVAKDTKKGGAIFAMPYEITSAFQSVRTLRLEKDQPLTGYITTTASRDQFGGTHMNSSPLFNCKMNLPVIPSGEGFTESEIDDLHDSGLSVLGNNRASNLLISGAILTTYKTNVSGQADATYKFLNYVDTSTASREYILNALGIDYAQSRLTLGEAVGGYDIATLGGVGADMLKYMAVLAGRGYVLIQSGVMEDGRTVESVIDKKLKVEFNIIEGRIYIESILPIITQVRSIVAPLSIVFNVNKL
jgi:phage tail sheath gpL-like